MIFCTTRVAFYSSVQNGTDPWYLHLSFFCAYFTVQRFRVHNVSLVITTEFTWNMYAQKKKKKFSELQRLQQIYSLWASTKFYSKSETMLVKHSKSPVWTAFVPSVYNYYRRGSLKALLEINGSKIFVIKIHFTIAAAILRRQLFLFFQYFTTLPTG